MKDYYYILGVSKNATKDEIKVAYKKLSKKFHPDMNSGDKFFEERFKDILEAYENLMKNDPELSTNTQKTEFVIDPEIVKFTSSKYIIVSGEEFELEWETKYCSEVKIIPFGAVAANGNKTYKLNNLNDKKNISLELVGINKKGNLVKKILILQNKTILDNEYKYENALNVKSKYINFYKKALFSIFIIFIAIIILSYYYSSKKQFIETANLKQISVDVHDKSEVLTDKDIDIDTFVMQDQIVPLSNYDYVWPLSSNVYIVNKGGRELGNCCGGHRGGKWGTVNKSGEVISPLVYDFIEASYDHLCAIYYMRTKDHFVIDNKGNYELDLLKYDYCGLLGLDGKRITEPIFNGINGKFYSGFEWVKKGSYWGVIDSKGIQLIDFVYNFDEDILFDLTIQDGYSNFKGILLNINTGKELKLKDFMFISNVSCSTAVIRNLNSGNNFLYNIKDNLVYDFNAKYIQHYKDCLFSFSNLKQLSCDNLIIGTSAGLINNLSELIIDEKMFDGIELIQGYKNSKIFIGVCNNCEVGGCGNASDCACGLVDGVWGLYDLERNKLFSPNYTKDEILNLVNGF